MRHLRSLAIPIEYAPLAMSCLEKMPEGQMAPRFPMVVCGDVAVIPVMGFLVSRREDFPEVANLTGHDEIQQHLASALHDPQVRGIALLVESMGGDFGELSGLCDAISAAKGTKPIWAVVKNVCLGAAYAIASGADRILLQRGGVIGGVAGCVACTPRPGDSSPVTFEPMLADDAANLETLRQVVSRNRGISLDTLRGWSGIGHTALEAVPAGLIDAIQDETDALTALAVALRKDNRQ
ncbi:hypothetical protein APZ41_017540 [Roseomonas mucosa]|uniref:Peptidase S49 domain-containing protein n=1 Tax=Roseomonas mucosa TaxID=207340 RepID=A0A1S8D348_9PROT|nr:hypothetical protein [Roseomonas mucosa]ONH81865.1 hypothetical protein APZ41_017540 [Roseomonas mucosa]